MLQRIGHIYELKRKPRIGHIYEEGVRRKYGGKGKAGDSR